MNEVCSTAALIQKTNQVQVCILEIFDRNMYNQQLRIRPIQLCITGIPIWLHGRIISIKHNIAITIYTTK